MPLRERSNNVPLIVLILLAALGLSCQASGAGNTDQAPNALQPPQERAVPRYHPVTAELIAEQASVQPGGQTRIGVHFDLEPEWHIYAEDPGDAGLPTKIEWTTSEGATFGPLHWPKAQRFEDPGNIKTNGYTGSLVLYCALKINAQAPPDRTLPIRAHVSWLACREVCVPGKADLELSLPVSAKPPVPSPHAELFDQVQD